MYLFFQTLIKEVLDFVLLLFPLTCSLCLINSIVTAAITKAVSRSDTGSVLGLNMAVHSAIRYVIFEMCLTLSKLDVSFGLSTL